MDDQERQAASKDAEQEREKGAALEYDTEDESALDKSASPPVQENRITHEDK